MKRDSLEMIYHGEVAERDKRELLQMGEGANYAKAVDTLVVKSKQRDSELKGALVRSCQRLGSGAGQSEQPFASAHY